MGKRPKAKIDALPGGAEAFAAIDTGIGKYDSRSNVNAAKKAAAQAALLAEALAAARADRYAKKRAGKPSVDAITENADG